MAPDTRSATRDAAASSASWRDRLYASSSGVPAGSGADRWLFIRWALYGPASRWPRRQVGQSTSSQLAVRPSPLRAFPQAVVFTLWVGRPGTGGILNWRPVTVNRASQTQTVARRRWAVVHRARW